MKSLLAIISSSIIFSLPLLAESTVATSGAWSAASTWLDSTVPTATSAFPLDVLSFNSGSLTLSDDTDVFVKTISLGTNSGNSINIASGKTFTLKSSGINEAALIQSSLTTKPSLTFAGDGTLSLSLSNNAKLYQGTYTFNSQIKTSGASLYFSNCTANVNNTWNGNSEIAVWGGVTLNINADFKSNRFNQWGNNAVLNLAEGKNMTINGAFMMTYGSINGKLSSSGTVSNEFYNISFGRPNDGSVASISWGKNATITSTATGQQSQIRNCKLTINSGEKSFTNKTDLLLNNAVITMNSSNVFNVKEVGSQEQSKFIIARYDYKDTSFLASKAEFVFNADNSFGEFSFCGASKLTLTDNGHQIFLGSMTKYDDTSSVTLVLNKLTDFCVKIGSLNALDTYLDTDGVLRASNITFSDAEGFTDDIFIAEDTTNGGYWLNSSAVPEPATFAGLAGLISLLAVYIRKRK